MFDRSNGGPHDVAAFGACADGQHLCNAVKPPLVSFARIAVLTTAAACAITGHAQSTPDDFEPLIATRKLADAETLARARTSANPRDDIAWWFLARAVADDPKKREALLPRVEACTNDLPQTARCHHALAVDAWRSS